MKRVLVLLVIFVFFSSSIFAEVIGKAQTSSSLKLCKEARKGRIAVVDNGLGETPYQVVCKDTSGLGDWGWVQVGGSEVDLSGVAFLAGREGGQTIQGVSGVNKARASLTENGDSVRLYGGGANPSTVTIGNMELNGGPAFRVDYFGGFDGQSTDYPSSVTLGAGISITGFDNGTPDYAQSSFGVNLLSRSIEFNADTGDSLLEYELTESSAIFRLPVSMFTGSTLPTCDDTIAPTGTTAFAVDTTGPDLCMCIEGGDWVPVDGGGTCS